MEWEKGVHLTKLVLYLIDPIYPSGGFQTFVSHFLILNKAHTKSVKWQGRRNPIIPTVGDMPEDTAVLALSP